MDGDGTDAAPRAGSALDEAAKGRVLFLDDEPAFLNGLRRGLWTWHEEWQTSFSTEPSAIREALAEQSGAVLVCDWHMPGIDGPTFCRELREIESRTDRPRTYVILLTGDIDRGRVVEGLDEGADDFLQKPVDSVELAARVRVGLRTVELERKMRIAQRELRALAHTDGLTGLLSRRAGESVLREEAIRVERRLHSLCLFVADVDHFKEINDGHGHAAGDRVLVAVAERMRRACRSYDSIIRWGGEEFLLLCPVPSVANTESLASRLLRAVGQPVEVEGVCVPLTISVGAVGVPAGAHASQAADWVAEADRKLYEAKDAGRDCVRMCLLDPKETRADAEMTSGRRGRS